MRSFFRVPARVVEGAPGRRAYLPAVFMGLAIGVIILVALFPGESVAAKRKPSSQTLTFTSVADARVEEATPTTNYGPEYLKTDNHGVGNRSETYLKFDVSGVSGTVTGAKVRLYASGSTVDGPAIWSAPNTWTEGGITWNNKPQRIGAIADDKGNIPLNTWVEFNVTSLVTGNGTYSFNLAQSSADGITFYQREYLSAYRPQLVVTTSDTTTPPPTPSPTGAVLVGAGDIATGGLGSAADRTAQLVEGVLAQHPDATVFTLGDNAYNDGTQSDYLNKYHPTWGRFKSKTKPQAGNHDVDDYGRYPYYFTYFGEVASQSTGGNYSYNLGNWHIISLNSAFCGDNSSYCADGSQPVEWLERDLAANTKPHILAYMHHPYWTSDSQYSPRVSAMRTVWDRLYAVDAEIVLTGHAHSYERIAPHRPDGTLDSNGIRTFIVGSGGTELRGWGAIFHGSEYRDSRHWGVLKLTLRDNGYDWQFLTVGGSVPDSGSAPVN